MTPQPLSDLTASLQRQTRVIDLRAELERAGTEVTTGQIADLSSLGAGNVQRILEIDTMIDRSARIEAGLDLAAGRSAAAQAALDSVGALVGTLGTDLLAALGRDDGVSATQFQQASDAVLSGVVAALNTRFAGTALFAGAASDGVALASKDELLDDLRSLIAAAPDAASARAAADTYFGAGGGFETDIYTGSVNDYAPAYAPGGQRIEYLARADTPEMRDVLKSLALIAVGAPGFFAGSEAEYQSYLIDAATDLQAARGGLTDQQAKIGEAEGQIAESLDIVRAESSALAISRNDISAVDPFAAATRFNDLQGQLDSLYTVTARLSGLSLTNYLR